MPISRKELASDAGVTMRAALRWWQADVWTALPGIVTAFDPVRLICSVQPAIQAQVRTQEGAREWVTLPLLTECPVVFPSGGGFVLTFPVAAGDECLVVFSSRCIDSWWQSGGVQVQAELRMHDLSDGFAIPGPRSLARPIAPASTTEVQLRNDDGTARFSIAPDGSASVSSPGAVSVSAGGSVSVTAPTISLNGNVTVVGTLTATGTVTAPDLATDTITSYEAHQHYSRTDDAPGSTTTTPIPG